MGDITNIKLGTCSVNFNNVDLGHTKGDIEFDYQPKYQALTADKYGDTPVDEVLIGEKLIVKVPLAEYTINNLRNAIPNATFAGAANTRITMGHSAGTKQSSVAAQLVIHPLAEGTRKFDIVLYKAFAMNTIAIKHNNQGERVLLVEFEALLDETRADGNYLGLIGDSTT